MRAARADSVCRRHPGVFGRGRRAGSRGRVNAACAGGILSCRAGTTFSASGVAEALAIIETDADIDVLFTDIGLSHDGPQAGLDLAREAVERRPSLKLLYTTGQTVTDGMRELFVEGAALLEKPYTVEDLKEALSGLDIDPQPSLT
jgi:CheY-like chemotaxis protein